MPAEEASSDSRTPEGPGGVRLGGGGFEDNTDLAQGDLGRLVDRLWTGRQVGGSVVVTTGSLPDGYVGAEEYVVVPSLRRARFLVPSRAPRAVASAFTAHLATVSARSRVYGRVIAAAFRYGLGERLLRDRLTVGIDARVPRLDWRHHLVMSELAHRLDAPGMVGIHPVRRFTPNAKPTVRLFDRRGTPLGYAKLGWSPPTRRLVRQEITALEAVDGRLGRMTVPHVLLSGRWSTPDNGLELEYVVTTALPPGLAPWRGTPESDADLLSAVAATGELQRATLAASRYSASLVDRLEASRKALPEETAALEGWLTTLQRRRQILDFGRWHGDWVAWNLASTASGGAVWDWEYSAPTVPVGFDLCHWYFQTRLAAADGNLDNAAAAIDQHAAGLRTLGVPPEAWDLVAGLYLLEMLVRATSLAAEGSGWNSKLHPRLLSFARERAASS